MIDEAKQAELLWAEVQASRAYIANQIRARFYLIGATFMLGFVLLLPAAVPPSILNGIAKQYNITDFRAPEELLSTLIWFGWLTAIVLTGSRSVVISREAGYLRVLESRLRRLAGTLVTRHSDFAAQRLPSLVTSEFAFLLTFSGATLLVGGNRLLWEWRASHWSPAYPAIDSLLFVCSLALLYAAVRDIRKAK